MKTADTPEDEQERLAALAEYSVLDTLPEACFDELTELAAIICDTPIVLVSLIDEKRQWFKSHRGLDATETPRDYAFCAHAILQDDIFEVSNSAKDERFHDNPLATAEPHVIFYAGAPLTTPSGHNIGTLCVIDNKPGQLSNTQKRQLKLIAKQVVAQLELRKGLIQKEALMNELLELNQKVVEKNEELFEFASRAVHDIKAPLRQVHSFSEMAAEDIEKNNLEAALKKHQFIHTICRDAKSFVDAIFDLTKADFINPAAEMIDLNYIVKQAINNNLTHIRENNIKVNYNIEPDIEFYSSSVRCQQIIGNLISNSIKYYNPEQSDPWVNIDIELIDDQQAAIIVADNGLGIPEKYWDKLFMPYQRFHPGAGSGTGLGMNIIKKHVDALKGTISFDSSSEGTRFTVALPNNTH